jgi:hypothetical protein
MSHDDLFAVWPRSQDGSCPRRPLRDLTWVMRVKHRERAEGVRCHLPRHWRSHLIVYLDDDLTAPRVMFDRERRASPSPDASARFAGPNGGGGRRNHQHFQSHNVVAWSCCIRA